MSQTWPQMWNEQLERRLADWHAQGLRRELRTVSGTGVHLTVASQPQKESPGREVISFASNDYLGLSAHREVLAAARAALENGTAGAGASPLISGHRQEHQRLETVLAHFKQSDGAITFGSGYQAALATLVALAGEAETIILDRLAHASLVDGARLSGARVRTFKHNQVDDLRRLLLAEKGRLCLIALESLYSMDGDTAPLDEIVQLAGEAGALVLVDEAHATGVLGARGRGVLEAVTQKVGRLPAHVVALGTLSKALGCQGGFICARQTILDMVLHAGRAYMFSTALSPVSAAAATAALNLIDAEPERRVRLAQSATWVRQQLSEMKLTTPSTEGPIIPVLLGGEERSVEWGRRLWAQGLYVPPVRYPTVKKGQARLRISLSAEHTPEECARLCAALAGL